MFSSRWIISVIALSLLFAQLTDACAFAKRSAEEPAPERRVVRRKINFPDTNAGKTINKGGSPKNKACKKWFQIRDFILRDIFQGMFNPHRD
jgi:hypothetical protein